MWDLIVSVPDHCLFCFYFTIILAFPSLGYHFIGSWSVCFSCICLLVLYVLVFVLFLFLFVSGVGCGLWLMHFLDFSVNFFMTSLNRGSTVGFLLLQCSSGVVRHPRDLQVSVATRFCRVLIFASSQYLSVIYLFHVVIH